MSTTSQGSVRDVPPILALIGLGLVVGGYLYLESPTTFSKVYLGADRYMSEHGNFLSAMLFLAAINGIWLYSLIARAFGLNKQGSRLEVLTGKRQDTAITSWKATIASTFVAAAGFGVMTILDFPGHSELMGLPFGLDVRGTVLAGLRLNAATTVFIVTLALSRLSWWKSISRSFGKGLPELPQVENGIVLGSIGDDDPNGNPSWALLNRRALNGNLLITGSIGGGKTQGTILPYLDQILRNFKVRPSLLLIDPKGTFIPEAKKIIAKHGLNDHVLHMKLGGNVTFNPIFSDRPLKDARFLETAQMIRAAAVNFMGKSLDSPFWEISAFNLIKNSLVLCGAKYCEV